MGNAFRRRLILSSIWHVGSDVDQAGNSWIRPGFSNYGSPIAVSDQNARSILSSKDTLRNSHIFFKGSLRLLDDTDVVAILEGRRTSSPRLGWALAADLCTRQFCGKMRWCLND